MSNGEFAPGRRLYAMARDIRLLHMATDMRTRRLIITVGTSDRTTDTDSARIFTSGMAGVSDAAGKSFWPRINANERK